MLVLQNLESILNLQSCHDLVQLFIDNVKVFFRRPGIIRAIIKISFAFFCKALVAVDRLAGSWFERNFALNTAGIADNFSHLKISFSSVTARPSAGIPSAFMPFSKASSASGITS